jgi:hypothetical protein
LRPAMKPHHCGAAVPEPAHEPDLHWRWGYIWNETTSDENFAEKWNSEPRRAEAFYAWHTRALADLADIQGLDQFSKSLSESFGPAPVTKALGALTEKVAAARRTGSPSVASSVGLSVGAVGASTGVRPNTFFGAK